MEASRHVGAAEVTPSPIVAPKAKRIDESAVDITAPRTIGDQLAYRAGVSTTGTIGSSMTVMSPQPEKRENCQDNDNQSDQVNQPVHFILLALR